jgi:hypothetical protein
MPSAVDCPGGFGSNPLGDAVTGSNQSDCEEKPSLKFATPGSGRNEAIDSLPSAGSRSTLTCQNDADPLSLRLTLKWRLHDQTDCEFTT